MLDEYVFGNITRMSPEAPTTPVILMKSENRVLGGAANVAHNIVSLGGKAILLGCVGNDENGRTNSDSSLQKRRKRFFCLSARHVRRRRKPASSMVSGRSQEWMMRIMGRSLQKELALFQAALRKLPSKYRHGRQSPITRKAWSPRKRWIFCEKNFGRKNHRRHKAGSQGSDA